MKLTYHRWLVGQIASGLTADPSCDDEEGILRSAFDIADAICAEYDRRHRRGAPRRRTSVASWLATSTASAITVEQLRAAMEWWMARRQGAPAGARMMPAVLAELLDAVADLPAPPNGPYAACNATDALDALRELTAP